METLLASPAKEVAIGPGRPFVIVGERINPTGRKAFADTIAGGKLDVAREEALAQVAAGAPVLDVNAGIPGIDEADLLVRMIGLVSEAVDVPLCIDSSTDAALEAGLDAYDGKALVNSVTGEEDKLERILPVVKRHGAAVIGLASDERGPLPDPAERLAIARKIVQRAADHGVAAEDVIVDPMAMAVGAEPDSGAIVLETMRLVRDELGANLICGASNVSFGMPGRPELTATFVAMARMHGLTCAIANPLSREMRMAALGGDVLLGIDRYAGSWLKAIRAEKAAEPGQ
ncbi:MAG TPA: dihydropteroate synthase [Actinomycetota bacterium]|nr:dihydropteroate synthase [Actinomycetota bacterium]